MKKAIALVLAMTLCGAMFAGCQSAPATTSKVEAPQSAASVEASQPAKPVEITVVSTFGGDDGNRKNYEECYKAFEKTTGNTVKDASGTAVEEFKSKVLADFETGAEPDVLFYFNGSDANKIVQGGKVVTIDEIRATYPDYASNMKDELIDASPADGKKYAVPLIGYWEGMYVNKKVLKACGVEVPGADYTWDKFLADCEKIKAKNYTPIAMSIQEVPHYWFEFLTMNHGTLASHLTVPKSSTDEAGKAWAAGLNDFKTLYEKGYFPKNTTTATDAETIQLMADDKAAFAVDGSWKMGWFREHGKNIDDFTVTYAPGANGRKTTDMIGGVSSGYYITKKAWDDPTKQKACVDFITSMTTDENTSKFAATSASTTALKNGAIVPADVDAFNKAALNMLNGTTGLTAAVQDCLNQTARSALFADVKNVAAGKITAEKAIDACLAIKG